MSLTRRTFIKNSALTAAALSAALPGTDAFAADNAPRAAGSAPSEVFYSQEITKEKVLALLDKARSRLTGKVAIKLHSGEPHGPNILPRDLVRAVQASIPNSRLVECNVLYSSPRRETRTHRDTLKINGWDFGDFDIMDENGDAVIPVAGGKHLKELNVGKNMLNYDSMLVFTHFKGHAMGGFGGSMKNIAIGCASGKVGKAQVHGVPKPEDQARPYTEWPMGELLMELMADSAKAICDHFKGNMAFINVMRRMSVDCDCAGASAAEPTAPDLGVLVSTDLLAIDQAAVDLIYALPEAQKKDLVERIESRKGLHQLTAMEALGLGNRKYRLVEL